MTGMRRKKAIGPGGVLCFDKKASGFRAFRGLGTYGSFSLWPVMRDLCRLLSVSARMSRNPKP